MSEATGFCIDLFAGPGGLGEGFHKAGFNVDISIEKEATECETLRQRKIHHLLLRDDTKDKEKKRSVATKLASGKISVDELEKEYPDIVRKANEQVVQLELGKTPFKEVYKRISGVLEHKAPQLPLVLLGGPPCQAYSIVGRSRNIGSNLTSDKPELITAFYEDTRQRLYEEYLKVIAVFSPKIFIMENVRGILSARAGADAPPGSVINRIIEDIKNPGVAMKGDAKFMGELNELKVTPTNADYRLFSLVNDGQNPRDFLIKSEDYGVPQARHRMIICGIKSDMVDKQGFPDKLERTDKKCTLEDVLGNLPPLRSKITRQSVSLEDWKEAVTKEITRLTGYEALDMDDTSPYASEPPKAEITGEELSKFIEDSLGPITDHKTRSHMISDLARYYFCADFAERKGRSPKIQDWPPGELAPKHRGITQEKNRLFAANFADRFRVQLKGRPSSTITSHMSKDGHYYIHPDKSQCRSLSVREAARIQTFPDSYQFCGGISRQFHQIGNAVPPFLAYKIANIIKKYLEAPPKAKRPKKKSTASQTKTQDNRPAHTPDEIKIIKATNSK